MHQPPSETAPPLTHFDDSGAARMVDVGEKPITSRVAVAEACVEAAEATIEAIRTGGAAKGDVLAVARLAGIMAAKRAADLIPLCHPLPLNAVDLEFAFPKPTSLAIRVRTDVSARTGVEMEAMTAASVAALTVYDMVKAIDRGVAIGPIRLIEKHGGKSGSWIRGDDR